MKKSIFAIMIVALLYGCTQKKDNVSEQSPTEIILSQELEALTRWSHGDPWGFIDLAAPEITYFAEGVDTLIIGYEAFKEVNAAVEGLIDIPTIKIRNPRVDMHGDIGILTYTLLNINKDGEELSRWKSTEVYKHIVTDEEDAWKLVHSHWTVVKDQE